MEQRIVAEGDFKTDRERDEHVGRVAWIAVCAKAGVSPPPNLEWSGCPRQELHDRRKAARAAVDKIQASIGLRDVTDAECNAQVWAGLKINALTTAIDGAEERDAAGSSSAWRDSNGRQLKLMRTPADFRAHYARASNQAQEGMTAVDFFRGVANIRSTPAVRNAMSEGTNTAGGFTIPSLVMPGILEALVPQSSLLRAGMAIVPLEDGAKTYTTAVVSTIPTAAWRSEGGAVSASDAAFTGVVATPQSLSFQVVLSRELLADSPNMDEALLVAIGQSMGKELDRTGLRGTGSAPQPRGVLNTSGIQAVTNGANGTSLVSYANLFSAVSAILAADAPMPTAAIMAPRSLVKLGGLTDTTTQPVRVPPMLENMKLLATSQVPIALTVGTSSDCSEIYLGDFTKMALMLRQGLSVQLLSELYAGNGQLAFMCHCRADFSIYYPAAFAVVTGVRP